MKSIGYARYILDQHIKKVEKILQDKNFSYEILRSIGTSPRRGALFVVQGMDATNCEIVLVEHRYLFYPIDQLGLQEWKEQLKR